MDESEIGGKAARWKQSPNKKAFMNAKFDFEIDKFRQSWIS
jgi:hypothetical protein